MTTNKKSNKERINNKFSVIFLLTAVFAISFLITLIISLSDYIGPAFLNLGSDDDAIYWVLGTIVVSGMIGLICAYMIYNKVKNNYSLRAKIIAGILSPPFNNGNYFWSDFLDRNDRPPDPGAILILDG